MDEYHGDALVAAYIVHCRCEAIFSDFAVAMTHCRGRRTQEYEGNKRYLNGRNELWEEIHLCGRAENLRVYR